MDTEKQTELFKVPAQSNMDRSDILHDFKKVSLVTSKNVQIALPSKKLVNMEMLIVFVSLVYGR